MSVTIAFALAALLGLAATVFWVHERIPEMAVVTGFVTGIAVTVSVLSATGVLYA